MLFQGWWSETCVITAAIVISFTLYATLKGCAPASRWARNRNWPVFGWIVPSAIRALKSAWGHFSMRLFIQQTRPSSVNHRLFLFVVTRTQGCKSGTHPQVTIMGHTHTYLKILPPATFMCSGSSGRCVWCSHIKNSVLNMSDMITLMGISRWGPAVREAERTNTPNTLVSQLHLRDVL